MNESELIQAARGGDEAAFEQLVRLHEKKIYNLCLRMCGSSEDAAEAAQDTFLALWRGLEGFREDAALSTWLYRLASNACIDLLRRNKRTVDGVSLDDEDVHLEVRDRAPTPEEHVEGRETQRLVREGLAALRRITGACLCCASCTAQLCGDLRGHGAGAQARVKSRHQPRAGCCCEIIWRQTGTFLKSQRQRLQNVIRLSEGRGNAI